MKKEKKRAIMKTSIAGEKQHVCYILVKEIKSLKGNVSCQKKCCFNPLPSLAPPSVQQYFLLFTGFSSQLTTFGNEINQKKLVRSLERFNNIASVCIKTFLDNVLIKSILIKFYFCFFVNLEQNITLFGVCCSSICY